MQLKFFIPAVIVSLAGLGMTDAQRIEKPTVFKDHWAEFYPVTQNFWQESRKVDYSKSEWPKGTYPEDCVKAAEGKCALSDMTAFAVQYSDCNEPWTFCRCNKSKMDLDKTIDIFGRVPVKARVHVKNVMLWPPNNTTNAAAYFWNNNIGIYSDKIDLFIMLHEVGHALDRGLSSSDEYRESLAKDPCVLTAYSQNSANEALADLTGFVWYHGVNKQASNEIHKKFKMECLSNQWAVVSKNLGPLLVPGGECPPRVNKNARSLWVKRGLMRPKLVKEAR